MAVTTSPSRFAPRPAESIWPTGYHVEEHTWPVADAMDTARAPVRPGRSIKGTEVGDSSRSTADNAATDAEA